MQTMATTPEPAQQHPIWIAFDCRERSAYLYSRCTTKDWYGCHPGEIVGHVHLLLAASTFFESSYQWGLQRQKSSFGTLTSAMCWSKRTPSWKLEDAGWPALQHRRMLKLLSYLQICKWWATYLCHSVPGRQGPWFTCIRLWDGRLLYAQCKSITTAFADA